MSEKNSNYCPECGNENLISDDSRGEIICDGCGLVLIQRIIDSMTKQGSAKRLSS